MHREVVRPDDSHDAMRAVVALPGARGGDIKAIRLDAVESAELRVVERDIDLARQDAGLGLRVPHRLAGFVGDQFAQLLLALGGDRLIPAEHRDTFLDGPLRPDRQRLACRGDGFINMREHRRALPDRLRGTGRID